MSMLPMPKFIDFDPATIEAEMVAQYEALTERTLYPAQAERLMLGYMSYRESLIRQGVNEAAKQNLLRFSAEPIIDYIGELMRTPRLGTRPAQTTLRFSPADPLTVDLSIPAMTRVQSGDGAIVFATDSDALLLAGEAFIDVAASCTVEGLIGNGWQSGQVGTLLDALALPGIEVSNVSVSRNGADVEETENYRERIQLAPEAFSTAGSEDSYIYHARSAHQDIVDVRVDSSTPGTIELYILVKDGLPDSTILTLVEAACSGQKVRPLCDTVVALAPTEYSYAITGTLTLYDGADPDAVLAAATSAAEAWVSERRARLGRDVVIKQIEKVVQVAGVYEPHLTAPAASHVLADSEWANCTGINLSIAGSTDG